MTLKERASCVVTIELLKRLVFNVHGVMDAVDIENCDKIIKMLKDDKLHWIPCSEKLPNEGEEVLVTSNSGIFIAELSKTRDKTINWFETVEGKALRNVTAWMPLPEPYGGESE